MPGEKILITGMISNRSIAYGVARRCHREGAELAFTYQGEKVRERVMGLAKASLESSVYSLAASLGPGASA